MDIDITKQKYSNKMHDHVDGLAQDLSNSIANKLQLMQSMPMIYCHQPVEKLFHAGMLLSNK